MKAFVAVLLALVLADALRADGDWTTYHGDPSLSGCAQAGLPARPVRLWRFPAGAAVIRTPVAQGETIVVVTDASELIALDLKGGKRWSVKVEKGRRPDGAPLFAVFQAPPAIVNGRVLIGSAEGVLYAFDLATGTLQWTNAVGGTIGGSAAGFKTPDGAWRTAVISQPDGALHAFEVETGKRVWSSPSTARCDGSPSVGDGMAVFGTCSSIVHRIDTATGRLVRSVEVGENREMAGGVALSGRQAFVGTRKGNLACIDLDAGTILWSYDGFQGELFTTPAVCGDRVVFAADDGFVRALRRDDGSLVWSAEIGEGPATSPVIAGDTVAAAGNGKLVLLALRDGARLWSAETGDDSSGPAIIAGMIVIGGDDGLVSAYGEPP